MINIVINGKQVEIDAEMSVQQMLDTVEVPPNYLAVEINANVIPRKQYDQTTVKSGDVIEVVTLVGGG